MPSRRHFLRSASLATAALYSRSHLFALQSESSPLEEFSYGQVELAPGLPQTQFEQTQSVLLSLNEDSLLKPWRLRAGLPAPGSELGGWYDEVPLDQTPSGGHGFAPGHSFGQWISALSRGYAINRDTRVRAKVERLLALYQPAISGRFYTNFRFPAYVYDKMVIGLIDAHQFAELPQAFPLLDRTTDAAQPHLPPHALDRDEPQRQWLASVGANTSNDYCWDEPYTLPENLFLASQRGAGEQYKQMAGRYLLAEQKRPRRSSRLQLLQRPELRDAGVPSTGSQKHVRAAGNAFDMITTTQSYATGGWGPDESFRAPNSGDLYASLTKTHKGFETPCGSYAHFKLTRYLLRVTRDGRYGDSMERVLYNTVLGAKRLEPDGHAFYYSDYNLAATKSYFPDLWPCCSGTLPQVAADYRVLTYFHDPDGIYVNLYLPSTLKWTATNGEQLALTQTGDYPITGKINFTLRTSKSSVFTLRLRIPAWASQSSTSTSVRVNGNRINAPINKGFASIRRNWKDGDRVELNLPMPLRLEAIDTQHPDTVALLYGPLVLFAVTEDLPAITRQQLLASRYSPEKQAWQAETSTGSLRLLPFISLQDERYTTYLNVT